jgi:hypothetical protein
MNTTNAVGVRLNVGELYGAYGKPKNHWKNSGKPLK